MIVNLKYKCKVGIHTAMPARPKKPLTCEYHQRGLIGLEDIITVPCQFALLIYKSQ